MSASAKLILGLILILLAFGLMAKAIADGKLGPDPYAPHPSKTTTR